MSQPKTLGTITVTPDLVYVSLGNAFGGGNGGGKGDEGPGETSEPELPLDVDDITIENNLGRDFTPEELAVIQALAAAIANISQQISQLSNSLQIQLPNGNTITGAQLKALWGEIDFTINPNNHNYSEGYQSGQGSAVDTINRHVAVNFNHLAGYAALYDAGLNYFVLHELAHMTSSARNLLTTLNTDGAIDPSEAVVLERHANDIAKAIANTAGLTIISNPAHGYTEN